MKILLLFILILPLMGEEPTKLVAGKPEMKAPTITIPEVDALKIKNAQQDSTIRQYQIQEYWKTIQALQEIVKKDGEVIQNLSVKVFTDAKVSNKDYKFSDDGLRLEKVTAPVAKAEPPGGK